MNDNTLKILVWISKIKSVSPNHIHRQIIKKKNYNDLVQFGIKHGYLHFNFILTY